MSASNQNRYYVRLVQPPVLTNDLGVMSEAEVYKFIRERVDAIRAENMMSELQFNGAASVEFTTSLGSKARIEITRAKA